MSSDELTEMRALAHPTRVAILGLLRKHAALTATQCATTLGLSAKTCSYHLQTLSAAGLVVELAAGGRNRPWRLAAERPRGTGPEAGSRDAAAAAPMRSMQRATQNARAARVRRDEAILGHAVDAVTQAADDPQWSPAATVYARVATMSASELQAWGEDVERLTRRHVRRAAQSAELGEDAERAPVRLMFYGFPNASAPID